MGEATTMCGIFGIIMAVVIFIIGASIDRLSYPIISVPLFVSILWAVLMLCMKRILKSVNSINGVTTLRLMLVFPLLPFIWIYYRLGSYGRRSRRGRHMSGLIERCCKLQRPSTRYRYVLEKKSASDEGMSWYLHSYLACFIQWGCCVLNFTKDMSINEAIHRYVEGPRKTWADLLESIQKNKYLSFLIDYLSEREPKFYFRILPSGSIREGFGYPLPSTSVLASDYDLMLVPDGIFVYDEFTEREGKFPASFTAVDDPNQNPERPKGFLWLKLENTIEIWKELCYERMTPDGGTVNSFDLIKCSHH